MFSPFLQYGVRYNAAQSTCGSAYLVLPKILRQVNQDKSVITTCLAKALWTSVPLEEAEFMLDQTLICVNIPEHLQVPASVLTADKIGDDLVLPVYFLEVKLGWTPPEFISLADANMAKQAEEAYEGFGEDF